MIEETKYTKTTCDNCFQTVDEKKCNDIIAVTPAKYIRNLLYYNGTANIGLDTYDLHFCRIECLLNYIKKEYEKHNKLNE